MRALRYVVLAIAGAAAAAGTTVEMNVLRLRPSARVDGGQVRAIDVLEPVRADAELRTLLSEAALIESAGDARTLRLSIDEVRERLIELGVNPARVLLRGPDACVVTFAVPPESHRAAQKPVGSAIRRDGAKRGERRPAGVTLADRVREYVQRELAELGGEVELEFELAGGELLELTSPPFSFDVRPLDRSRLGLRRFDVMIRRDGKLIRRARLAVRVRLVRDVLVAARPLNVGMVIDADALELSKRVFVGDQSLGFQNPKRLIGQQVRRFIPAGQMLRAGDLKAADLVRRGRPVTVIQEGAVRLRVAGIALDSGTYGSRVRVQLGANRRPRRVVRGEVVGVATVRLVTQ